MKKKRKLIVCLACRVNGNRLFGKPLQNLDIKKSITILDIILIQLKEYFKINQIILAISKDKYNECFVEYSKKKKIDYYLGDDFDVLKRLIEAYKKKDGTDIFRITTESPFIYLNNFKKILDDHYENNYDLTSTLDKLPDGVGYEIIKLKALETAWKNGKRRHRSELCTLFIRENSKLFNIHKVKTPNYLNRNDLRLTVDYPEDLIFCRNIYSKFKKDLPNLNFKKIIKFIDKNPQQKKLVNKFVIKD